MIKIKQHTYLLPIINTLIPSYANISENCEKFPLKKIPIEIWDWVKEAPCAWLSTSLSRAPRNMRIECRKWYNESYWQPSRSIEQATHFPIQQLHYNFNCMIGAMVSVRKTANLSISLSYTTLLPMSLCPVFWYFFFYFLANNGEKFMSERQHQRIATGKAWFCNMGDHVISRWWDQLEWSVCEWSYRNGGQEVGLWVCYVLQKWWIYASGPIQIVWGEKHRTTSCL